MQSLFTQNAVVSAAQKYEKSEYTLPVFSTATHSFAAPAQVLLRWATQRGIAVIPKSNSLERLTENLKSDDFNLEESELKAISSLNINLRVSDYEHMLGAQS